MGRPLPTTFGDMVEFLDLLDFRKVSSRLRLRRGKNYYVGRFLFDYSQ